MRILFIHHCDSWGGAGVSLKCCCEMLSQSNDITVCLPHGNSCTAQELGKNENIKLTSVEDDMAMISAYNGGPRFLTRTFAKNFLAISSCKKKICNLLNQGEYDLVIVNSITLAWLCKPVSRAGIPVCVYVRETKPAKHLGFLIEKHFINRYADGVLFISEYDRETMRFTTIKQAVVRDTVKVDDNTIEGDKEACRQKLHLPEDKKLFLFMGGMDELKGYEYAVRAMDMVNAEDILLVIAGNTNPSTRAERDNIIYVGLVSETFALYRACDALIFPSIEGHQARPAFEAGFAGIPVIISEFPQTSAEVIDGYNGLTVPPKSPVRLAALIQKLSKDEALRKEYGENNRKMAWERHAFLVCKTELASFLSGFQKD